MDTVRLAYRDTDRTPVIFCIQAMAAEHYDLDVQVLRISGNDEYEAAPFDGSCDLICEHQEYLYEQRAQGLHHATMFVAPVKEVDDQMVVGAGIDSLSDLEGKQIAVRTHGRPYAIAMRIRELGLEGKVELVPVADQEVGRWGQWKKVVSGECAAAFMTCLYLPGALEAGLRIFPAPGLHMVGQFAHACDAAFARAHDDVMVRYLKATVHAIALMKLRREAALDIVSKEPARLMGLTDNRPELERYFDCIAGGLQLKPYPTPAAIANSYEIACHEYPGAQGINPLTLWDLHWLKQLDDEGFIDDLLTRLK
jgi:hypothetical protein